MKKKEKQKRVDLDVRNHLLWENFDLYEVDADESGVSPGKGFYNRPMGEGPQSVQEFRKEVRKRMKKKRKARKKALLAMLDEIKCQK